MQREVKKKPSFALWWDRARPRITHLESWQRTRLKQIARRAYLVGKKHGKEEAVKGGAK